MTASPASYTLEHFYYGQNVRDGQPQGEPRLLARSAGITSDIFKQAIAHVMLPPLIQSTNTAWALVRGNKQLPFVMVQAQIGEAGQVIHHYVLFPNDVLRAMGGRVRSLKAALVQDRLPVFMVDKPNLQPLRISEPEPENTEQQIDDILDLMTTAGNKLDVMESLLAAIVQGVPLVVQGAPNDLDQRVKFIEGLLSLLPPSVRFAVTFTTHSLPTTDIDVQIRFYSDDAPPKDALVYLWPAKRLSGAEVSSDYSRFVISQLRLDAEQVIERTRALTPTTGWRMRQGDRLVEALAYGSYRQRIDEALLTNQPVNKDDVARILSEDPTLNDSLRMTYARHLLRLSLAMNDMEQADPVLKLLPDYPELEQGTLQHLAETLTDGQAEIVFVTLNDWLSRAPDLNYPDRWTALMQRAALTRADEVVNRRQIEAADRFVRRLQLSSHPAIPALATRIIERLLPLATKDAALAENTFLLAVQHTDTPVLQRLLEIRPFVEQLHRPLQHALAHLTGNAQSGPRPGLLGTAAASFGAEWRSLILLRLAEWARFTGRSDLLDTQTLRGVADSAGSVDETSRRRLAHITTRLDPPGLVALGEEGGYHMLRILLAAGAYAELAAQMIQQAATLYLGDKQIDYIQRIERLFAESVLSDAERLQALQGIEENGIRSGPLVMAAIGTLHERDESPELNTIATWIEELMNAEPLLLGVISPDSLLVVLNYHARRGDQNAASRIAEIIPAAAARQNRDDLEISGQIYAVMQRDPATRAIALDLLRAYVRQADEAEARQAIASLGGKYGLPVRNTLETTLLVRSVLNAHDLETYAGQVRRVTRFLEDTAAYYTDPKTTPQPSDLFKALDLLQGKFSSEERRFFTRNMLGFARALVSLYQQHKNQRGKGGTGLLKAEVNPASVLDVLRVIAGYAAQGRRYNLRLQNPDKPLPLSDRSRTQLNDEVSTGFSFLSATGRAISGGVPGGVTAQSIREEIESQLTLVSDLNRRDVIRALAVDLQKLVDLIEMIAESGDAKALEDSPLARKLDSGKQRPRSTLEFYRFMYGYFVNNP